MKVSQYMSRAVLTVTPQTEFHRALHLMRSRNVHHLPVVDGERVVGIVAERDLLLAAANSGSSAVPVGETMSRPAGLRCRERAAEGCRPSARGETHRQPAGPRFEGRAGRHHHRDRHLQDRSRDAACPPCGPQGRRDEVQREEDAAQTGGRPAPRQLAHSPAFLSFRRMVDKSFAAGNPPPPACGRAAEDRAIERSRCQTLAERPIGSHAPCKCRTMDRRALGRSKPRVWPARKTSSTTR